ncbi:RNA exonuclease 5 isoform X2 [Pseudophryne corroboree]
MSEYKVLKQLKKRRDDIKVNTVGNGLNKPKMKKASRLSPALFCDKCEIQHRQLHQLLKFAILGKEDGTQQASWCNIHHQSHLRGVVIIILEDLSQHHFYQFYLHFPCVRRLFRHRFILPPPPRDFIASLVGLNKEEKDSHDLNNRIRARLSHDPILRKYGTKKHGLTRYLLTEEEMRVNDYPLVGSADTNKFVRFSCTGAPTDSSPLFGLDCEMCLTNKGDEVTRVSLVDSSGNSIMDELVKPDNPILDYRTSFSGITRNMLLPVKTKLKDVQNKLRILLPPSAVLVGHSLHYDMQALRMIHPNVIDTAILFTRTFERKFKLKFLTQAVLKREIQRDDVVGHNPSEDAAAALELAQYFIEHGPEKVALLNLEEMFVDASCLQSPLAERDIKSQQNDVTAPQQSARPCLADSLVKLKRQILYIGKRESVKNLVPSRLFKNILCTSDEDVLERASSVIPQSPVSIVQFQSGSIFSECSADTNEHVRGLFEDFGTVFVRPFKTGMCMKSVKIHFQSCGPINSMSIVTDDSQPCVRIQYSVPEAAQLAVNLLNGIHINGCCITVRRLVTSRTLYYNDLLKEMEDDPEISGTIYVSGFPRPLTEDFLQRQFSHFKDIKAIFVPTNPQNQLLTKYCYIKFHSPVSAAAAADYIQAHGGLRSTKAVTSSHLHRWLRTVGIYPTCPKQSEQEIPPQEDHTERIKDMDRKINNLYESLLENTLCVILFPGNKSDNGSLPGFGLMGIKTDT